MPILQVVVAVDHRVLGVVGQHPEQVAREQPPRPARARCACTAAKAIGMPKLKAMPSTACGIETKRLANG